VVREYEAYYELKLGRKPKLVRKVDESDGKDKPSRVRGRPLGAPASDRGGGGEKPAKADGLTKAQTEKYAAAAAAAGVASQTLRGVESKLGAAPTTQLPQGSGGGGVGFGSSEGRGLDAWSAGGVDVGGGGESGGGGGGGGAGDFGLSGSSMKVGPRGAQPPQPRQESIEERLLKPLPFAGDLELRALAQTISRDIFVSNPGVKTYARHAGCWLAG